MELVLLEPSVLLERDEHQRGWHSNDPAAFAATAALLVYKPVPGTITQAQTRRVLTLGLEEVPLKPTFYY